MFYVYSHKDPETNEIKYIGHGRRGRAWYFSTTTRSAYHYKYLTDLENKGYDPSDWVSFNARYLSKDEACSLERKLIKELKPEFNKIQGEKTLKVTPESLKQAFLLRKGGKSFSEIASELNVSTMTIHRAMSGKSPALEEILERSK